MCIEPKAEGSTVIVVAKTPAGFRFPGSAPGNQSFRAIKMERAGVHRKMEMFWRWRTHGAASLRLQLERWIAPERHSCYCGNTHSYSGCRWPPDDLLFTFPLRIVFQSGRPEDGLGNKNTSHGVRAYPTLAAELTLSDLPSNSGCLVSLPGSNPPFFRRIRFILRTGFQPPKTPYLLQALDGNEANLCSDGLHEDIRRWSGTMARWTSGLTRDGRV